MRKYKLVLSIIIMFLSILNFDFKMEGINNLHL